MGGFAQQQVVASIAAAEPFAGLHRGRMVFDQALVDVLDRGRNHCGGFACERKFA